MTTILCLRCGTERKDPLGKCPECKRPTAIVRAESAEEVEAWKETIRAANRDDPNRERESE